MADRAATYSNVSRGPESVAGHSRKDVGQRIAAVCELIGTRKQAAAVAGISEDQLSRYIRGKSEVSFTPLARLVTQVGVRLDWLWHGKGPMLADLDITEEPVRYGAHGRVVEGYLVPPYRELPNQPGDNGVFSSPQLVDEVAFRLEWLRRVGLSPDQMALVQVVGDSMEPTFGDGDLVLVDTGKCTIAEEGVYALRQDDHLIVKRLQLMLSGDVHIKNDNEAYSTQIIRREAVGDVQIVGRVVWVGRRI